MDGELRRCPFCGAAGVFVDNATDEREIGETWAVFCGGCEARGPRELTPEDAAKYWNRRRRK